MSTPIAYTVADAAEAVGVSPDVIRRAIRAGAIEVRYPTARPVIPADSLREWFRGLPTERAAS